MGRTRQQQQEAPEQQRINAAAAIGGLFLASQTPDASVLAVILLPFLPLSLLRTPELAADVAEEAARLALTDPPSLSPEVGEFELRASLENILKRGFYAIAAVDRLSEAALGSSEDSDTPVADRLAKALRAERSYLTAHRNAAQRRLVGGKLNDAAVATYGPILSWQHGVAGAPVDPRPNHVAADGKSFDTRRGPPISMGAWPGVLPGCTCRPGPPKQNAQMLT